MPRDYASHAATVLSVRGLEFFAEVPRLQDALSESRHTADGVVISQYPRPAQRTQHGIALAREVRAGSEGWWEPTHVVVALDTADIELGTPEIIVRQGETHQT